MSNDWFRFKRFTVQQSGAAMKVGTDGVLLGAWARIDPRHRRYLDIGTGTGLIALMLAQRISEETAPLQSDVPKTGDCVLSLLKGCGEDGNLNEEIMAVSGRSSSCGGGADSLIVIAESSHSEGLPAPGIPTLREASIDAVEIDAGSAIQAAANVAASPWSHVITVYHNSIQEFSIGRRTRCACKRDEAAPNLQPVSGMVVVPDKGERRYDHIVSNPPWFVDSLLSPDACRSAARHVCALGYTELIGCVRQMLASDGAFSVVLPADSCERFVAEARTAGLELCRRTWVQTLSDTPPKRVLMEFGFSKLCLSEALEERLVIELGDGGGYTEDYRSLTGAFYLKF